MSPKQQRKLSWSWARFHTSNNINPSKTHNWHTTTHLCIFIMHNYWRRCSFISIKEHCHNQTQDETYTEKVRWRERVKNVDKLLCDEFVQEITIKQTYWIDIKKYIYDQSVKHNQSTTTWINILLTTTQTNNPTNTSPTDNHSSQHEAPGMRVDASLLQYPGHLIKGWKYNQLNCKNLKPTNTNTHIKVRCVSFKKPHLQE
jgi:hypothetical protein